MVKLPSSIEEMAQLLGYSKKELCHFSFNLNSKVAIRKKPKTNGEFRSIIAPNEDLKRLLKLVDSRLLRIFPLHELLYLKPKSSYILMIRKNENPEYLITADIDDFFPSVKPHKVIEQLQAKGYNKELSVFLTSLITMNNQLPQGFPTSSTVASIIIEPVLKRLMGLSKTQSITVSLYADNLVISSSHNIHKYEGLIKRIFSQNGFLLDDFKVMSKRDCQEIKNITLNNGLSVKKTYRKEIRDKIFLLCKNRCKMNERELEKQIRVIRGKLNYVKQVNYKQARELMRYSQKLDLRF